MSEHFRRHTQSSRDLLAVPIPAGHPANVACVSRHRTEDAQHLIHNRDQSPVPRSRSSVSRQVDDESRSPGKNGKNLPPLPNREPRHIFLIPANLVQGQALHIERGLGRFSNGSHLDPKIQVYLDAAGIFVTLGLFSRDRGISNRRGRSSCPEEFYGSTSQAHLPAWAMASQAHLPAWGIVFQKKGHEAVKDSRPLSPPPGIFNEGPKFYIEGAVL